MKSPRRLPTLPLPVGEPYQEDERDEDYGPNPFYLGATGKTPRPTDSVEQALGDKMRDFILQTGGGFASVDLRKIHQGPALVPEGVITVGKRPHVMQKGPPKALARILHRLNRKHSLITRYFADQTLNRWKISLLYILFRAWANVTASRPKTIDGMLQFIKRARGRGVRFWFNRWHQTHNKRCRSNIRMRELKLLNEHRLRLLEIETHSLEAQQVNGLVASDLQDKTETVENQAKELLVLQHLTAKLQNELQTAQERLVRLDNLLANPAMFIPERTAASLIEWDINSREQNINLLKKVQLMLDGLAKRPWQEVQLSIGLEKAAQNYRAAQLKSKNKREQERCNKLKDPFKFNTKKHEQHVNPLHPRAKKSRIAFWEREVTDIDIHHLFHRLKQVFKSSRLLYGQKVTSTKTLFFAMDTDDDGTVSRMELWESMQRLDLGLSVLQLRTVLHAVDVDNSGTIELLELKVAFKKSKKAWKKWKKEKRASVLKTLLPNGRIKRKINEHSMSNRPHHPHLRPSPEHQQDQHDEHDTAAVETTTEEIIYEDMETKEATDCAAASRGDRDGVFRLRWFQSLSEHTKDIVLPQDLRDGKLWCRVLDKLSRVSVFASIFVQKQYIPNAGQERNRKRRIALVVQNLRNLGICVPRSARTPVGFLETSDAIHLSMANEVMCRFPGIFVSNGPLHVAQRELNDLKTEWSRILKLHHIVNARLAIIHSFGNISNVDEMYLYELDKSQKEFFQIAHVYQLNAIKCYNQVKHMERKQKGGERRMLQIELSSSLENSNRLLQHIEDIQEKHKQQTEAEGEDATHVLTAEEDRRDLLRYSQVPAAWQGSKDELEDIQACLMSNSIEARRIFRYYSKNGAMSIGTFLELCTDASVLSEIESYVLIDIFKITVERMEPGITATPYISLLATAEQFVELCLRLAKAMREHLNVADGLQDIWDKYMCQTRPPKLQWSSVRNFMHSKNIMKVIETHRSMLYQKFHVHMTVPPRSTGGTGCLSRSEFYDMCMAWGHVTRGIPPGFINLMFSHATGTFDLDTIRKQKCPMVFPQFVVAVVALFLQGGVDPFLESSRAFVLYLGEHLGFPKPLLEDE